MMTEEKKAKYQARQQERVDMRSRIEADLLPEGLSQAAQDKLWELAWEHGHSSGESEVRYYYGDFADLAEIAAKG
jgi:hypothetical protein